MEKTLTFKDKIQFDTKGGSVLGILEGPCADCIRPTRNGRGYNDELWEKVWEKDTVKEMLDNGGIFGELEHPTDRDEVCPEKIAIRMAEQPIRNKDGVLIGKFEILNTPCGNIAYTLAKAGFKWGISSRGNGETYTDENGNEQVDPDSYEFTCFDLVLLPAVESARLNLITESKQTKKLFDYKKALNEQIENANDDDKKIIKEALDNLNIDYHTNNSVDNKVNEKPTKKLDANNIGSINEMVKSLQEALTSKSKLQAQVFDLQKQVAVGNAKVKQLEEKLKTYKSATLTLSDNSLKLKESNSQLESLQERVATLEKEKQQQTNRIKLLVNKNRSLIENHKKEKATALRENVKDNNKEINSLKEKLSNVRNSYEEKIKTLNEELAKSKQLANKSNALTEKLDKAKKLVEYYKDATYNTLDKYISHRAKMLGISNNEIKNKLNEKYSIEDIDKVFEDIRDSRDNLPFDIRSQLDGKKIRMTESKNDMLNQVNPTLKGVDDIDDDLLSLAGVLK